MAAAVCNVFYRALRLAAAPVALLISLPLCGCSFDLGSWAPSNDRPQPPLEQKPTGSIGGQSTSDAQGYATRGQALARSGKPEEALAEFDRALALDPYNVQALYGRGLVYQGEKKHAEAVADFTAAHGLSPQRADPLVARAISYLAQDKVREAAGDLDEAVQAEPNNAHAWSTRGQAYEKLGDKAKAQASYSRAIAIQPRDNAARAGLARVGG